MKNSAEEIERKPDSGGEEEGGLSAKGGHGEGNGASHGHHGVAGRNSKKPAEEEENEEVPAHNGALKAGDGSDGGVNGGAA